MADDTKLEDFIHRLYEIKNDASNQTLQPGQLKDIAFEVGITEKTWDDIQDQVRKDAINDEAFLKQENYQVAIERFDKALAFNPFHPDALIGSAEANYWLYRSKYRSVYKKEALDKANQCLEVVAGHSKAIRIITNLEKNDFKNHQRIPSEKIAREAAAAKTSSVAILSTLSLIIFGLVWYAGMNMIYNGDEYIYEYAPNESYTQLEPTITSYHRLGKTVPLATDTSFQNSFKIAFHKATAQEGGKVTASGIITYLGSKPLSHIHLKVIFQDSTEKTIYTLEDIHLEIPVSQKGDGYYFNINEKVSNVYGFKDAVLSLLDVTYAEPNQTVKEHPLEVTVHNLSISGDPRFEVTVSELDFWANDPIVTYLLVTNTGKLGIVSCKLM